LNVQKMIHGLVPDPTPEPSEPPEPIDEAMEDVSAP